LFNMSNKEAEKTVLFLDACCLINLLATNQTEEILAVLPFHFATSRLVATREVLALAYDTAEESPLEREVIPTSALEDLASLTLLDLTTEREFADFVRFASVLDDGEASVCALALAHGGGVATDDRKALAVLNREEPQVLTVRTPELLYDWAHLSGAPPSEVARVLRSIERKARFRPRRGVPRFEWWVAAEPRRV
jgi:hypothetical protein